MLLHGIGDVLSGTFHMEDLPYEIEYATIKQNVQCGMLSLVVNLPCLVMMLNVRRNFLAGTFDMSSLPRGK